MRGRVRSAACIWVGIVACAPSGCARLGGGDAEVPSVTITILNGGQSAVRVAIDRSPSLATSQVSGGSTVTDLTPLVQPGDSTELELPLVATPLRFDAFAIVPSEDAQLRGPFRCEVDALCLGDRAVRAIWTGADLVCTSLDRPIAALHNGSDATVYLLVADEEPDLPLLPLSPGESRFTPLPAGLVGGVRVRAMRFDSTLGVTLIAFSQCPLVGTCLELSVVFDGRTLSCGEP